MTGHILSTVYNGTKISEQFHSKFFDDLFLSHINTSIYTAKTTTAKFLDDLSLVIYT